MTTRVRRSVTLLVAATLMGGWLASTNALAVSPSHDGQSTSAVSAKAPGGGTSTFEHWATITRLKHGYYYDAGQQDMHLVVTEVKGGLLYTDTKTNVLRGKPDSCDRRHAERGLIVFCHVPRNVTARNPYTVKVFGRLGNDYVNTSALSARFDLYGLCDAGNDTFIGGAGNDFVNGAFDRDRVVGGAGNDLLRGGTGHDVVIGGPGNDVLVGLEGPDRMDGQEGNDRVAGDAGDDTLKSGPGVDFMLCYTGRDTVEAKRSDKIMADCENVTYNK